MGSVHSFFGMENGSTKGIENRFHVAFDKWTITFCQMNKPIWLDDTVVCFTQPIALYFCAHYIRIGSTGSLSSAALSCPFGWGMYANQCDWTPPPLYGKRECLTFVCAGHTFITTDYGFERLLHCVCVWLCVLSTDLVVWTATWYYWWLTGWSSMRSA